MPGLYLHIPFCKQACYYCNFHFSTSLKYKEEMVAALIRELEMQKDYLDDKTLTSVYLGGGTPSLLNSKNLEQIFTAIDRHFQWTPGAEITLEANPDDLDAETVKDLARSPVNRLSIGIQSFSEEDLRFMNRAHTAREAEECIDLARTAGFEQLTVDLIYGAPTTSDKQWAQNLERIFAYAVPHLSCYCLTVEPGTALGHFVAKGKVPPVDEEKAARQLEYLMQAAAAAGFIHYEISNFAQAGQFARHNTAYWMGEPYLGIGPSAHSFNGHSRQWNIANNAKYLKAIAENRLPFEREQLTSAQRYNEYILTGLRTMWGVSLEKIGELGERFIPYFLQMARPFLEKRQLIREEAQFYLSQEGKLIADRIAMELFWEE